MSMPVPQTQLQTRSLVLIHLNVGSLFHSQPEKRQIPKLWVLQQWWEWQSESVNRSQHANGQSDKNRVQYENNNEYRFEPFQQSMYYHKLQNNHLNNEWIEMDIALNANTIKLKNIRTTPTHRIWILFQFAFCNFGKMSNGPIINPTLQLTTNMALVMLASVSLWIESWSNV